MVHAVDYPLLNKLHLCLRPLVVHLRFKANFVRSTLNFYIRLLTHNAHTKRHIIVKYLQVVQISYINYIISTISTLIEI